jgi:hypothetical protein
MRAEGLGEIHLAGILAPQRAMILPMSFMIGGIGVLDRLGVAALTSSSDIGAGRQAE